MVNLQSITGIVIVAAGVIMTVAFTVVLVHILRNGKNPWLIKVVVLLLLS